MDTKQIKNIDEMIAALLELKGKIGNMPIVMSLDSEGNEYSDIMYAEVESKENFDKYCTDLYLPMPKTPSITEKDTHVLILVPAR